MAWFLVWLVGFTLMRVEGQNIHAYKRKERDYWTWLVIDFGLSLVIVLIWALTF